MKLPYRIPADAVSTDENGNLRVESWKILKFMGLENTAENQKELSEAIKVMLKQQGRSDMPIVEEWT